jgi:hypothetical protein
MSLEIHIYGPGFGETIFLRWPARGGGWHGALVDSCSPDDGLWLEKKLRSLELNALQFVVATHPHLDHIEGLGAGLARSGIRSEHLFYWPGLSSEYWIQFYDTLGSQKGGDLKGTAQMVREWFGFCGLHYEKHRISAMDVGGKSKLIFSRNIDGKDLHVKAIGPWLNGINRLVKNVSGSIERGGAINYQHDHGNHVSIALLLEYGEAQVVLGGDMEDINWNALMAQSDRPKFKPSVVKVSHHGSSNGRINTMWPKRQGFFGEKPEHSIAVVTPWSNGGRSLPEEIVLSEIRDSGYTVYVTGDSGRMGRQTRDRDSHVSIRLESDGSAEVFEHKKARLV